MRADRDRSEGTFDMAEGTWLVTGGAGYIGAHVVRSLQERGIAVVVLDNLSSGDASRISVPLEIGDVADEAFVTDVLTRYGVDGVIHLAARKQVAESVRSPLFYYDQNVAGFVRLLSAMQACGVGRIVFSSSAAVYGNPSTELVPETAPTVPANPYGESKVIGEWLVRAQAQACGLRYVLLRYFNVAGTAAPELIDHGVTNLVPLVFQAVLDGAQPAIFGADYPTPDGTCIRDFVHVADLAQAHAEAIALLDSPAAAYTFNVGTGTGASVRDVIDCVSAVTGVGLNPEILPRRQGDPARVVGDVSQIQDVLGWRATRDLRDMATSMWSALKPQS